LLVKSLQKWQKSRKIPSESTPIESGGNHG
jgi:hypothetical protein